MVDIGPGHRWGRVYGALEADGLTIAGGRKGNVNVAGLLFSSGIDFFSAQHSLACDNVVECEVVLANRPIIRAGDARDMIIINKATTGRRPLLTSSAHSKAAAAQTSAS